MGHGGLGRAVGEAASRGAKAGARGEVDDDAAAPPAQVGEDSLTEEHHALEVDGEDAVPLLLGHVVDGAAPGDGGAVHQNVDAPEALDGAGHGALDGGLVGGVGLHTDGGGGGGGDLLGDALHAVWRRCRRSATAAPSRARVAAVARPIPEAPPVMIATLP